MEQKSTIDARFDTKSTQVANKKNRLKPKSPFVKRISKIMDSKMSNGDKAKTLGKIGGGIGAKIVVYIALIALSVIFIVPFFFMISRSLFSTSDLANVSIKWLPRVFNFENYVLAFDAIEFWKYLGQTIFLVGSAVFAQIMVCSFVAYGISRVKFRMSGVIFALIVFTLLIPPQTISLMSNIQAVNMNWQDSFLPIIVPCVFGLGLNGGLIIFVFRQFFRGMPAELENAALIDGTGIFGAYFRVIFPNAAPSILTTSILSLVWQWNNNYEPSLYVKSIEKGTIVMQLPRLNDNLQATYSSINTNAGIQLAGTFLSILPILIIFIVLQRNFMKSITTSGLAN
jgi:ABC-type sugar transport system, permease component